MKLRFVLGWNRKCELKEYLFSRITENVYLRFQVTTWDWTRAEKSFTLYEIMFKILKVRAFFFISGSFSEASHPTR